MRAHQIMTKKVTTTTPQASILEAANIMLREHISGLPVVDRNSKLVGIVSEGDFIRRDEIGTQKSRSRWFQFILGPGKLAVEFVHARGRRVCDVMADDPVTATEDTSLQELVRLMEKNRVKRLPIMRNGAIVGIVTRSNLLAAVAGLAREIPDPSADDDHIRNRIIQSIEKNDWKPLNLEVVVCDGIVHISGIITDERSRRAAIVAAENVEGVQLVHDHLCWVDAISGLYLNSPEDEATAKAS